MPDFRRFSERVARRAEYFLRTTPRLARWRIDTAVDLADLDEDTVENRRTARRAEPEVSLGANARDETFLQICKYYQDGRYARPELQTAEILEAGCHVGTGLVCTRDGRALNDSQMAYRLDAGTPAIGHPVERPFRWFKPWRMPRRRGLHATIGNLYGRYWGHWIFDCLPRLHLLAEAAAGRRVTLLVPERLPAAWHESLEALLPPGFEIRREHARWVRVERMLVASYPSGRANFHLAREFYDFMRHGCFTRFGLPRHPAPRERIYVSRAGARHRRVRNEAAVTTLLGRHGFRVATLETMSFRAQVELFHRAEIVVAAEGSNWANMMFAGPIPIVVLYSDPVPNTHWFTAAKGLGQEHFFLNAGGEPHADFEVDVAALESLLLGPLGLTPRGDR